MIPYYRIPRCMAQFSLDVTTPDVSLNPELQCERALAPFWRIQNGAKIIEVPVSPSGDFEPERCLRDPRPCRLPVRETTSAVATNAVNKSLAWKLLLNGMSSSTCDLPSDVSRQPTDISKESVDSQPTDISKESDSQPMSESISKESLDSQPILPESNTVSDASEKSLGSQPILPEPELALHTSEESLGSQPILPESELSLHASEESYRQPILQSNMYSILSAGESVPCTDIPRIGESENLRISDIQTDTPKPTEDGFSTWPGVVVTLETCENVAEPPARWMYFTISQLVRYFSDRQISTEEKPITNIRTLAVIGNHAQMLAHYSIRLPPHDEEDLDELIFGTALDTCSPLFVLPSTIGLAAQVVYCDDARGPLTPERCDAFTQARASGASVWAMCGVPRSVRDERTGAHLSLNEYAAQALGDRTLCINAEDQRDLILLLHMAPALRNQGSLVCPGAFVHLLLNGAGRPVEEVLADFTMRKVGKSRRKALDVSRGSDPLAALRVYDSEMGDSDERIMHRLDLLSEVLQRATEEKKLPSDVLPETRKSRDQSRLLIELEQSQQDTRKWKSYAAELKAELDACGVGEQNRVRRLSHEHKTEVDVLAVHCAMVSPLSKGSLANRKVSAHPVKAQACCSIM